VHAGFKRQTRPRTGLLENHHQRAVAQWPVLLVRLELILDPAGAFENVFELFAREILELQKVFNWYDLGRQKFLDEGSAMVN